MCRNLKGNDEAVANTRTHAHRHTHISTKLNSEKYWYNLYNLMCWIVLKAAISIHFRSIYTNASNNQRIVCGVKLERMCHHRLYLASFIIGKHIYSIYFIAIHIKSIVCINIYIYNSTDNGSWQFATLHKVFDPIDTKEEKSRVSVKTTIYVCNFVCVWERERNLKIGQTLPGKESNYYEQK